MGLAGKLILLVLAHALLSGAVAPPRSPEPSIFQYKHTAWTADDGAPSFIGALAQGADGFLWIGSNSGLFRFDGLTFEPIAPRQADPLRRSVTALHAARNGAIWVGYDNGDFGVYRGNALRNASMPTPSSYVIEFAETQDGAIWASLGRTERALARFSGGAWQEIGEDWGLPPGWVIAIKVARDGSLWVTTSNAVSVLRRGARRFEFVTSPVKSSAISQDPRGRIWLSDLNGSRIIQPGASRIPTRTYPTPGSRRSFRTMFDSLGNLWGAGAGGVFRVRSPAVDSGDTQESAAAKVEIYRQADGLTSDRMGPMLEDREGNIWVGTTLGLDRFRRVNVLVEPTLRHRPDYGFPLLGASDGSVYVGTTDAIHRIVPGGSPERLLAASSNPDWLCEGPAGTIWIFERDRLLRMRQGRIDTLAMPVDSTTGVSGCIVDRNGALWASAGRDGLFRLDGGNWRRVERDGKQELASATLERGANGDPLVSLYSGALVRLNSHGQITQTLLGGDPDFELSALTEGGGGLFMSGARGIAKWRGGRFEWLSAARFPWLDTPGAMIQTPEGNLWLIGPAGIVGVPLTEFERAIADRKHRLDPAIFSFDDGLPDGHLPGVQQSIARGGDGRLWFPTYGGVVWIDPNHILRNPAPPPVKITRVAFGNTVLRDPKAISLPAGTAGFEIDYTALSLSVPGRTRFRYRLEGADRSWVDSGARREAFYNNLSPGKYRFQVIAANSDGVWNRTGASIEIELAPTFVQSGWFVMLCLLALGGLIWLGYVLRLRQVTARLQGRFQIRIAERERIARELHDTLLQGFQGLMLRFQTVADRIPETGPLRGSIDDALNRADALLIEGRRRVRELRGAEGETFEQALADAAETIIADAPIAFHFTREGRAADLAPLVSDEALRIAEEAIRNAVAHANPSAIEAVAVFGAAEFRLAVRDDGAGIPPEIAAAGVRPGHYGLIGMRERAERVGGTLTVSSREHGGTEIMLRVPGRMAYRETRRWLRWPRSA